MRPKAIVVAAVLAALVPVGTGHAGPAGGKEIWISAADLAALPMSGEAWRNLELEANKPTGSPDVSDKNDSTNVRTMAKALVYARSGVSRYRTEVIDACMAAIGTEEGGDTLALGRNLIGFVLAADLVVLPPDKDSRFRDWLEDVRVKKLGNRTLISTHEDRPNNWGTHAGGSRVAVALYLGDMLDVERSARVFQGWLGDRSVYAQFSYGSTSWQGDASKPVGINAKNTTKEGHPVDGVLADDQRRSGGFRWPPRKENYVYEALQGVLAQAVMLDRAGYDVWNWSDKALLRAFEWLHEQADYPAEGDDTWEPHLVNHFYGTSFPAPVPTRPGKNVGWTDWTHGSGTGTPIASRCTETPLTVGCRSAEKAAVKVVNGDLDAASSLQLSWFEGEEATRSEFGAPISATDYEVCLYDTFGGDSTLEMALPIAAGVGWEEGRSGRYRYKQHVASLGGKLVMELSGGEPGRARIRLKARGTRVPVPSPTSSSLYFEQTPSVIVQAINDDDSCWSAEFGADDTLTNKRLRFNARAR